MSEPIVVNTNVVVPAGAMEVRAVRAGGPGGQNVNKVSSKIELRVDMTKIQGLDEGARARLHRSCEGRLDADGWLLITSQKTRDQPKNLSDAREKVTALIVAALVRPKTRRATRPTRGSVERRLTAKKRNSNIKRDRRSDDS